MRDLERLAAERLYSLGTDRAAALAAEIERGIEQDRRNDIRVTIADVLCVDHPRRGGRPCRGCMRGARAVIGLLAPRPDLVAALIESWERG